MYDGGLNFKLNILPLKNLSLPPEVYETELLLIRFSSGLFELVVEDTEAVEDEAGAGDITDVDEEAEAATLVVEDGDGLAKLGPPLSGGILRFNGEMVSILEAVDGEATSRPPFCCSLKSSG